jgi:hypothetical protein
MTLVLENRKRILMGFQTLPTTGGNPASAKTLTDQLTAELQSLHDVLQANIDNLVKKGTAVLVAGTKTVTATWVTAQSRIVATPIGSGSTGALDIENIVVGASFDIKSSDNADTRTVHWISVEEV